ncbi:MAG TPA: hypothetical protein VFJ74_12540 [Gemmatimonadaceae bacterium]|nr:hypothetical protein [Gemmatimonadaceae bacterium]
MLRSSHRLSPRRAATKFAAAALALTALAACADAPTATPAATDSRPGLAALSASLNGTINEFGPPFIGGVVVPCGRLGQELVTFSGTEHFSFQQQVNAAGSMNVRMHANAQGVTATGLVSGDTYHTSGATDESYDFVVNQFPFSYDIVYSFNMASGGAGSGNIHALEVLRVSYDANGWPTLQRVKFDAECR